jgi:adenylate cyclase
MTVPLLHRDEILGIMHLDSQIATNAFTEKDLQICTGMAAQAAIAIQNARLARRIELEAKARAQISRLVPRTLVEQVVKGELIIEKGGRLSEITMLYSDIRGFTAMSEGRPPYEVVNTLNEYFEVMAEVLDRHAGLLDKFVGDEIIGLFGAPIEMEDAPLKAVMCALDMLRSLREFNHTRQAEGQPPILIGIGINTGKVITGAIGADRNLLNYTAIGDAMNVASRLVTLAKSNEIIISDATYDKVRAQVEAAEMPPQRLKGKSEEMRIFRVVGLRGNRDFITDPTHS